MYNTRIGNLLKDAHSSMIILYLYFNGMKSKTEIYRNVSTNYKMPQKLENLRIDDMVRFIQAGTFNHPKCMVELTYKGEEVASGLCELEMAMGGSIENLEEYFNGDSENSEIKLRVNRTSCCR